MKYNVILAFFACVLVLGPVAVPSAEALSCLSIGDYLKDVAGKEENLIFTATSKDVLDEKEYTAEVLEVDVVKQGYVEKDIFVYHEKHPDWGYLCNSGPKEEGAKGLYVATRDTFGKINVHQRLELNDPLVKTLDADLKEASIIVGAPSEITKTDRMNQIITSIMDMFREMTVLLKEHAYWKAN